MHMPDTKKMEEILKTSIGKANKLGASAAKLTFGRAKIIKCSFEAGRLKTTGQTETASYSIEVVVGGKKGNTYGNRFEDIDLMVEQAVTLATAGSAAHFTAYPPPGEVCSVQTHSERTLGLTRKQMIESCEQITGALKAYDPDLYIACSARRGESERLLVTSGGVSHHSKRTTWQLGGFVQRVQDTDMLFSSHGRGWCDLNEFYDPNVITDRILQDLQWAKVNSEAPKGRTKAYLPPETVAHLTWPIFMGTNGRNVAKGDSPLANRLNEQLLCPSITIVDNPHKPYAGGSCSVDNDGIPTKQQTIVEKGLLKKFLYDLDSAGLAGVEPTGNDGCLPYSPHILPGTVPSTELLEQIDDGLYIRDVIGFGQSNVINGDFSANIGLGYRIKNGEIVGRVKNTMIAGNLYDILNRNVLISSDTDYEGQYPHLVVEGVSVSSH